MILNMPLIADLHQIYQRRQQLIDERTIAANRRRISHDYQPGDRVLELAYKPNKFDPRATGPYEVIATHVNGTVTIRRSAHVTERINIRRLRPFRS